MPTPLIGSIVCTPPKVRVGESMLVEVKAPDGRNYDDDEHVHVTINGKPGAKQYIQWRRPGKRSLLVLAVRAGRGAGPLEKSLTTVEISEADKKPLPLVRAGRRFESPASIRFSLLSPVRTRHKRGERRSADERAARRRMAKPRPGGGRLAVPIYHWDFGDGQNETSVHPHAEHDYAKSLDHSRLHSTFHLRVTVSEPGERAREIRRTISVVSTYQLAKRRGFIEPLVETELNARRRLDGFGATLKLRNLEAEAITLTGPRLQPLFDDPNHACPIMPGRVVEVNLSPKADLPLKAIMPAGQLPDEAVGFAVHYTGRTASGKPVRASAYYDIPSRRRTLINDPEIHLVLSRIARRSGRGISDTVFAADLDENDVPAASRPVLRRLVAGRRVGWPSIQAMGSNPKVLEGARCDPDNLPSEIPEDFACQATDVKEWVWIPDRFINARKGDIVLAPGGETLVAKLMRAVNPKQVYSHSGIMTRNFDQITHSTASIPRLKDHPNGEVGGYPAPTQGFQPNALRYLWPGAITQGIFATLHGEEFIDPEPGPDADPNYSISGFDSDEKLVELDGGEIELVVPMVIKPDPLEENPKVRQRLHKIADHAASLAATAEQIRQGKHGKSHYRLFCYTDPVTGLTVKAADDAGWAKGTFPSCCSSFIWICIKKFAEEFGISFEKALEPNEVFIADKAPSTPDGLYKYTADERLHAGELIFDEVKKLVFDAIEEKAGALTSAIGTFEDIGDDCGNQICNAFGNDDCSTEATDSEAWREQIDANAVSADDLMLWDAPSLGGLYGFGEPLIFRSARFEEVYVHRWKKVVGKGTLRGTAFFDGKPVQGARAEIPGFFDITNSKGSFEIAQVPKGSYTLTADKVFAAGKRASAKLQVTIKKDEITNVHVELEGPNPRFREVKIKLRIVTKDYHLVGSDVYAEKTFALTFYVHPTRRTKRRVGLSASPTSACGEEPRSRLIYSTTTASSFPWECGCLMDLISTIS